MDIEQPKPKIKQVIPTQKNPLSNESLQNFLSGNDLEQFEEYINTQFSNLSQDYHNSCNKYDKIFIENLSIPNILGAGNKTTYKDLREYIVVINILNIT